MRYWLMKSEPDVYSIEDLQRDQTELWDGVRNYQARNFLKEMALDDLAFFLPLQYQTTGYCGPDENCRNQCGRSYPIRPVQQVLRRQIHTRKPTLAYRLP